MGRRGPVSQPANLRLLRGNPGKRSSPELAAKVKPGRPDCPEWLSPIAKAEWHKLVPKLDAMGLIGEVDQGILATYCATYAHMLEAEELVRREGITAEGREHQKVRSPAWVALKDARAQVLALSKELYLSPVSRLRATITPEEDPQAVYAREILD